MNRHPPLWQSDADCHGKFQCQRPALSAASSLLHRLIPACGLPAERLCCPCCMRAAVVSAVLSVSGLPEALEVQMKILTMVVFVLAASAVLGAADISGKWQAEFDT